MYMLYSRRELFLEYYFVFINFNLNFGKRDYDDKRAYVYIRMFMIINNFIICFVN